VSLKRWRSLVGVVAVAVVVLGVAAIALARGGGGTGTTMCGNGTVTWNPAVVWPPNHKLVPITISWTENKEPADLGDSDNTLSADSVSTVGADDKGAGQPSKKQGPDYSGVPQTSPAVEDGQPATVTVYVRAERSGTDKAGRTYTINLTCHSGDDPMDGKAMAIVTVPHDMGNHSSTSAKAAAPRVRLITR